MAFSFFKTSPGKDISPILFLPFFKIFYTGQRRGRIKLPSSSRDGYKEPFHSREETVVAAALYSIH
jgi:hypothetical protein